MRRESRVVWFAEYAALGAALLVVGCTRAPEAALFEACYDKCVRPVGDSCPPGHEWCVLACRATTPLAPRTVVAHFASPTETEVKPAVPSLLGRSVGLETLGGVFTVLIPRCTSLPTEVHEIFSTAADDQASVQVSVFTGEGALVADNQKVGQFQLEGIRPAKRGEPRIRVSFRVGSSGALVVTAKDLDTGRTQDVRLE